MVAGKPTVINWTPLLIKQLRGKRTQSEFGRLIGAPKNTIWRWESGQVRPDPKYAVRLMALAEREHFLHDWKLSGSMHLIDDVEPAEAGIASLFKASLEQTSRQLME